LHCVGKKQREKRMKSNKKERRVFATIRIFVIQKIIHIEYQRKKERKTEGKKMKN